MKVDRQLAVDRRHDHLVDEGPDGFDRISIFIRSGKRFVKLRDTITVNSSHIRIEQHLLLGFVSQQRLQVSHFTVPADKSAMTQQLPSFSPVAIGN